MNVEQKNEYGLLIAKKSEKLVTALYLVTDLITDSEPIKANLRRTAITLLSSMNTLAQPEVKDRITEYKLSLKSVTEILSLLHVARTTGIVSDMNSSLLIDGYRSLQMVLEKKQPVLTEDMLKIDDEHKLQEGESFNSTIQSSSYDVLTPLALTRTTSPQDKQVKDVIVSNEVKEVREEKKEVHQVKGHNVSEKVQKEVIIEPSKGQLSTRHVPMLTSYQQRKVSRRDQILGLFVKGVDVSIKDIALRIKGCSEKTIQRELNALVFDNKIVRIGEKRWSRYLLK
jgi:hypothetical protein